MVWCMGTFFFFKLVSDFPLELSISFLLRDFSFINEKKKKKKQQQKKQNKTKQNNNNNNNNKKQPYTAWEHEKKNGYFFFQVSIHFHLRHPYKTDGHGFNAVIIVHPKYVLTETVIALYIVFENLQNFTLLTMILYNFAVLVENDATRRAEETSGKMNLRYAPCFFFFPSTFKTLKCRTKKRYK